MSKGKRRDEELELKRFDGFFLSTNQENKIAEFTLSSKRLQNTLKLYYAEVYPNQPSSDWLEKAVKIWQERIRREFGKNETAVEARTRLLETLASVARKNLESAYEELFNPMFTAILTTAQIKAEIELQQYLGLPTTNVSAAQAKKEVDIWRYVKPFLGFKTGGDRRPPEAYRWDDEKRKQFFKTVQQLPLCNGQPLWKYITEFFHKENYGLHCLAMLSTRHELADVPSDLLLIALEHRRRYWQVGKSIPRKLTHFAFALQHARMILDISVTEYESLKTQYYVGKKLLRESD